MQDMRFGIHRKGTSG